MCTPVHEASGERLQFWISQEDHDRISGRGLGRRGMVTDLQTGARWELHGRDCSAPGCRCDLTAKAVSWAAEPPPPPPPAIVFEVLALIKSADASQRQAIMEVIRAAFCIHCGGRPDCQCWNDE